VIKVVLHDISLNLIIGFTPGRDAEAASLGGLETPHGFHQTLIAPLVSSGNEPSQVGDVVAPHGPWTTSGPLPRGCS